MRKKNYFLKCQLKWLYLYSSRSSNRDPESRASHVCLCSDFEQLFWEVNVSRNFGLVWEPLDKLDHKAFFQADKKQRAKCRWSDHKNVVCRLKKWTAETLPLSTADILFCTSWNASLYSVQCDPWTEKLVDFRDDLVAVYFLAPIWTSNVSYKIYLLAPADVKIIDHKLQYYASLFFWWNIHPSFILAMLLSIFPKPPVQSSEAWHILTAYLGVYSRVDNSEEAWRARGWGGKFAAAQQSCDQGPAGPIEIGLLFPVLIPLTATGSGSSQGGGRSTLLGVPSCVRFCQQ